MKYKSELKIGITGILTIIVIIWGISFLKGQNILSTKYQLLANYTEVDGLETSAAVILHGYKIGNVRDINFETEEKLPFTVTMEIEKKYKIRKESIAEIFSADLLGTKSIKIVPSANIAYYHSGDTMLSNVSTDMLSSLLEDIEPLTQNLNSTILTLDSVSAAINELIRDPSMNLLVHHLKNISGAMDTKLANGGDISEALKNLKAISESIKKQMPLIESSIANLKNVSVDLNASNIDSLVHELTRTASNFTEITNAIESKNGSIGKLIYEDSIYQQLNFLFSDLDSLIKDINSNPKKYVHFSLIERKK